MSNDIHTAIIDRINELTELSEAYSAASQKINQIKDLEVELKMPNATVINRASKEETLSKLKQEFNDLQIIHLFSNKI